MDGEEKECICLGIAGRVLENPGAVTKDRWKGDLVSAQAEASSEWCLHRQNNPNVLPWFSHF